MLSLVSDTTGNAASLLCQGISFTHLLSGLQSSEPSPQAVPSFCGVISFLCVGGFREEWISACVPQDTLTTRAPPQLFPGTSQRVNPLHREQQPPGRGRASASRGRRKAQAPGPRRAVWREPPLGLCVHLRQRRFYMGCCHHNKSLSDCRSHSC